MSCVGELPKLDAAIFADTQWEPKAVYRYFDFLKCEAESHGISVYKVTRGDLRADAIEFRQSGGKGSGNPGNKRRASMPFFVKNPDGSVGLINRQCTSEYKIEPVGRFIRRELLGLKPGQRAPADSCRHWFGIAQDETYRVRTSTEAWQSFYYPLITTALSLRQDTLFGRGFDRQDCLDWIESHGYPKPPRSACIGCSFHSDEEWIDMRENRPEECADAVAFDHAIRTADASLIADGTKLQGRLVGLPYLHRSCVPLDEVMFVDNPQAAHVYGMGNECLGMCGV
jgi:hypothetical protein